MAKERDDRELKKKIMAELTKKAVYTREDFKNMILRKFEENPNMRIVDMTQALDIAIGTELASQRTNPAVLSSDLKQVLDEMAQERPGYKSVFDKWKATIIW